MRQFKLRNKAGTSSFDFEANKIIITEVAGLGSSFDITLHEGALTNYQKDLEEIALTLNYGVKGNAYKSFNDLAKFIETHLGEPIVLEYTANKRTVLAEVIVKNMQKSQKTGYGVLTEQLILTRMTYWYTEERVTVPEQGRTIRNLLSIPIELKLTINEGSAANFKIELKKDLETVSVIEFKEAITGTYIINAETKQIKGIDGTSYYNLTNKQTDSFIILPKGEFKLYPSGAVGQVVAEFKKWAVD